ncbi:hypothetical protein GQ457_08G023110 [Hibiscus cannabinus]
MSNLGDNSISSSPTPVSPQLPTEGNAGRRELAKLIIMHEYPLSIVDHEQFRIYCDTLQPMFNIPSRNTIKKDILDMFEKEKEKTLSKLEANEGRIAITTDMWTADHQIEGTWLLQLIT